MLDENGLLVNLAHSGHCRACKERVHELLTAIYGDCQMNQSFSWSSRPENYVRRSAISYSESAPASAPYAAIATLSKAPRCRPAIFIFQTRLLS